jgi:multisubunit Na+/H+ antiporter MnhB subunit
MPALTPGMGLPVGSLMTTFLLNFLYALAIDKKSQEPRRVVFFLLYYVIGFFVAFIVLTMVLLCLEVYDFPYARDLIYRELGEHVLVGIESVLF